MRHRRIWLGLWLTIVVAGLSGQTSLEMMLIGMESSVAKPYFQPLVDGWSHSIHLAQYSHPSSREEFDLYLGFEFAFFMIPDGMDSYTISGSVESLPTIFGSSDLSEVGMEAGYPAGLDFRLFPLYIPQLRMGNVGAFDFGVRYSNYDYGTLLEKIRLIGLQMRCSVDDWLETEELAISLAGSYHKMDIIDRIDAQAFEFRTMIGRQTEDYHLYGYATYMLADMSVTVGSPTRQTYQEMTLSARDPYQFGVGGGIQLWKLLAHTEISVYPHRAVGFGVGLSI